MGLQRAGLALATEQAQLEQTPGVGKGQGSLACYTPYVAKSQTQLRMNNKTWQEPVMKPLGAGGHFLVKLSSPEKQTWVGGGSCFHCHFFCPSIICPHLLHTRIY